jgi:hypothetical protein
MPEPIDAPLHYPGGGWPKALVRIEFAGRDKIDRERAAYEVACASRALRRGVVVEVGGVEMIGYPHQTADEIARAYLGLRTASRDARMVFEGGAMARLESLADHGRWTMTRKLAVLALVAMGQMTPDQVHRRYAVDAAELESWALLVAANGAEGLMATKLQQVDRG